VYLLLMGTGKTGIRFDAENYPQVLQRVAHKPTALSVPGLKFFYVRKFMNLLSIQKKTVGFCREPIANALAT
jgi:hypothetical protein